MARPELEKGGGGWTHNSFEMLNDSRPLYQLCYSASYLSSFSLQ